MFSINCRFNDKWKNLLLSIFHAIRRFLPWSKIFTDHSLYSFFPTVQRSDQMLSFTFPFLQKFPRHNNIFVKLYKNIYLTVGILPISLSLSFWNETQEIFCKSLPQRHHVVWINFNTSFIASSKINPQEKSCKCDLIGDK